MRQSITRFTPGRRHPAAWSAPTALIFMLTLFLAPGCGNGPAPTATPAAAPATRVAAAAVTVETPVTREVPVTVPVPVTRIVSATVTVPVTVETPVTREVPVTVPVPVTRIVTATPPPHTPTPDAAAVAPTPTLIPAASPTAAIIATPMPTPARSAGKPEPVPVPEPQYSVGKWQIHTKTYGEYTLAYADNQAVEYETDADPPILTYQCFRGQSSLFIAWQQPLFTRSAPAVAHRVKNPFQEYYDNSLDALVEYARELHSYISKEQVLTDNQRRDVADIWTDVRKEWAPDSDTPEALIATMGRRSHRDLLIELAITHENLADANDPNRKFRIPPHYSADYNWLVLSESKVQMYYGQVGSIKPVLRKNDTASGSTPDLTLTAIVKEPYQHADIAARWDVGGFRSVDVHISAECR